MGPQEETSWQQKNVIVLQLDTFGVRIRKKIKIKDESISYRRRKHGFDVCDFYW